MNPFPDRAATGEEGAELSAAELSAAELRRYGRHLILPEVGLDGQKRLRSARVLLVGAGGLGSPAGLYLAAAGVGTLGLVDFDRVDESNLQRQILYGQPDLGRAKVEAARERLQEVNPHIEVRTHAERLAAGNGLELVSGYDVVVDGSDNFPTRYLVNDACVLAGKPCVWGAISRFEGQASVFWGARGPCYRCLFPEPPPPGLVPSCAEGGVLGVLPGIIGSLQANEALKLLLAIGEPLVGRLLTFDALRLRFRELRLPKSETCPVCGPEPSITHLEETEAACEAPPTPTEEEPTMASDPDAPPFEIRVEQLRAWREAGRELALVDVREPHEAAICSIEGARLIPMRDLPARAGELDTEVLTVVHCHHGSRSAQVVAYLRERGHARATNLAGGIEAWSLEIDPSVPRY